MYKDKQKYLFEVALLQFTDGAALIRANEFGDIYNGFLPEAKHIISQTNLYCICKKPRLRVIENSLNVKEDCLYVGFEVSNKTGVKQQYTILKNFSYFFPNTASIATNKLYNSRLDLFKKDGCVVTMPIEQLFNLVDAMYYMEKFTDNEISGYEILYIGQAFGQDGLRDAFQRGKKHEMLQRILADVLNNEPYNEVFLLSFELCKPKYIHMMNGSKCPEDAINRKLLPYDISNEQLLSIAEACLIRYFEPFYNTHYKKSFPSTNLKILQECYKFDLNSAIMKIDTNIINITTYSQKVSPSDHHIAQFNLHSEEERLSFFALMKP